MEFRFNLNQLFHNPISKVDCSLVPSTFHGHGDASQCTVQVAEVVDKLGIASAKARDLHHPVTSSEEMKKSDHTLYLMIDPTDNKSKGIGFLKIGEKLLFLNDKDGMVHEKKIPCVLDFYVHESKQRTGHGKKLFDYMLHDQNIPPHKLAIDGPIEPFLAFVSKHYGLTKIYPQNNNFVIFEGFFSEEKDSESQGPVDQTETADRVEKDDRNCYDNPSVQSYGYTETQHGRHTAHKPEDHKFAGQ